MRKQPLTIVKTYSTIKGGTLEWTSSKLCEWISSSSLPSTTTISGAGTLPMEPVAEVPLVATPPAAIKLNQ